MNHQVKKIVKQSFFVCSHLFVFPSLLIYLLHRLFFSKDLSLSSCSEMISIVPGLLGNYSRKVFYYWTLNRCHPSVSIGFGTIFSKAQIIIEENVYIGSFCNIGYAHIQRDCLIASGVMITSGSKMHGTNDTDRPIREQPGEFSQVVIGQGCWIGAGAIVMAHIGRDTVVASGSVVNKDIPEFAVAAGVPAKVVRFRKASSQEPVDQSDHQNEEKNAE